MKIVKGKIEDLTEIMELIRRATNSLKSKGIYQWDDIYPSIDVIKEDIIKENLYIYLKENGIKAIIVLNEEQAKEYEELKWEYNIGKQLVIHRLCVHPEWQGIGIAKELINFAEKYAKEQGYNAIRLDAFSQNKGACNLYKNIGYKKTGTVLFNKGEFYCFEKGVLN